METKKYTGIRVGQADSATYVEALAFCQAIGYQGASGIADQMPSKRLEQLDGAGRKRTMISLEDALVLATKKGRSEVWLALQAAIVAGEEDVQVAKPADLTVATTEAAPLQALSASEPPKPRILGSDIFGLRGDIRIVDHNGNDWYVANEVAKALDYTNPHKAILDHCKGANETLVPSNGGMQLTKIISAGDVFALVNNSQLPGVQPFKDWINHKVLVSIDKTGEYKLPEPVKETAAVPFGEAAGSVESTRAMIEFTRRMLGELEAVDAARNKAVAALTYTSEKLNEAEKQIENMLPDAVYGKLMASIDDSCNIDTFARHLKSQHFLNIDETTLYQWLRHHKLVSKCPTAEKWNKPLADAISAGYLVTNPTVFMRGTKKAQGFTTQITPAGQRFVASALVAIHGIPTREAPAIVDVFPEEAKAVIWSKKAVVPTDDENVGTFSEITAKAAAKAAAKFATKPMQTEFIICQ